MQILSYTRLLTQSHSASFRNFRIITVRKDAYHITPFWSFRAGPRSGHALHRASLFLFALWCAEIHRRFVFAEHTCLRAELTIVIYGARRMTRIFTLL